MDGARLPPTSPTRQWRPFIPGNGTQGAVISCQQSMTKAPSPKYLRGKKGGGKKWPKVRQLLSNSTANWTRLISPEEQRSPLQSAPQKPQRWLGEGWGAGGCRCHMIPQHFHLWFLLQPFNNTGAPDANRTPRRLNFFK